MTPLEYVAHGWALVPIPKGRKGPLEEGWNERERCVVPAAWRGNIGLAHAYSDTCAIDIDNLEMSVAYLKTHGIDLNVLLSAPDAVMISSGKPNRAKLLYRLDTPLVSKKIVEKIDGKPHSIIDFRCATATGTTVQDVLPPSIHPETKQPYTWRYAEELIGDWRALPELPPALRELWVSLVAHRADSQFANTEREPMDLDELRARLATRDPDADRDSWVEDLAIIHYETRGSDEGLELAVEWSSRSAKFKGRRDVANSWRSFHLDHPNPKTAASWRIDEPASLDDFDVIEAPKQPVVVSRSSMPALDFTADEDGWIYASKENLKKALSRSDWCGSKLVLDTFRDDIMLAPHGTNELRPLRDTDYDRLAIWLEFNQFKTIPHEGMRRAVALVADDQQIDSAQLWLTSLEWDGVSRVETFLADYFLAGDTPYTRAVSLYWWTAHAGRVMDPGCKADMVPILVGKQGVGKSTGVAAIAPAAENFVEVRLDQEDEEIARRLRGCLVAEIGELRGLQSREAESIKSMITTTHDKWTPKYVERSHIVARRLVFVGTTNNDEFLADETGNRRWLPVCVGKVRVAAITADRLQLWAEARNLWQRLGVAFGAAETLAREMHHAHMVHDVWEENIMRWLDGDSEDEFGGKLPAKRGTPFAMTDILSGALGLDLRSVGVAQERRVGKILRVFGFVRKDVKVDGRSKKLWVADGRRSETL